MPVVSSFKWGGGGGGGSVYLNEVVSDTNDWEQSHFVCDNFRGFQLR